MKKQVLFILILLIPFFALSQPKDEANKVSVKVSGFVKNDMFWDTRQTVAAREGHFLLWPADIINDSAGVDINDVPNFNFLAIQSKISVDAEGPESFKAKISGKIEGDFFATSNDYTNLFRLRHAYLKLNWKSTEFLFGQYWIPMFVPGCFPEVVSFNTGSPIQPFGRNPQFRLTQKINILKIIFIASSQRDYSNIGLDGKASGAYLRNSAIPELSGQLLIEKENPNSGTAFLIGAGGGYKRILPALRTDSVYQTKEMVEGFSGIAFMKIKIPEVTLKVQGVYGQNITDALCIGGFGISDTLDIQKAIVEYTPLNTLSFWAEIQSNGQKVQLGLFGGYTTNMGADNDIIGGTFGFGKNIQSIYRIAPRIVFNSGSARFAFETEYTAAAFGDSYNEKGVPTELETVTNIRFLFAAYYFF